MVLYLDGQLYEMESPSLRSRLRDWRSSKRFILATITVALFAGRALYFLPTDPYPLVYGLVLMVTILDRALPFRLHCAYPSFYARESTACRPQPSPASNLESTRCIRCYTGRHGTTYWSYRGQATPTKGSTADRAGHRVDGYIAYGCRASRYHHLAFLAWRDSLLTLMI